MAKRKAAGKASNLTDSKPKYLGIKANQGQAIKSGSIIVRQRGTRYLAGENVGVGKDYSLFALVDGTVDFRDVRKTNFDGSSSKRKQVRVLTQ